MNLKDEKQQNIQKQLDFPDVLTGEAREASRRESESSGVRSEPENPASTDRIMEVICEWRNLKEAMRRVKTNRGSAGIDGMRVDELPDYTELLVIRGQLLSGAYEPQPVKRQAQGERQEERVGPTTGAEVSRIQFHRRSGGSAQDCANS